MDAWSSLGGGDVRRAGSRGLAVLLVLGTMRCAGAGFVEMWSGSQPLPDNDSSGWAYTFTSSVPDAPVSDVNVTLKLTGGFNGDLYAYLVHGSGQAVLLNRAGRDTGMLYGYPDTGFSVTLDDEAPLVGGITAPDLHLYETLSPVFDIGGGLTGLWQPDARTADPAAVVAGSPRSAFLSNFDGLPTDGSWTIFIADLSAGGVSTLESLSVVVEQVPEPSAVAAMALAGLILAWRSRRRRGRSPDPRGSRPL